MRIAQYTNDNGRRDQRDEPGKRDQTIMGFRTHFSHSTADRIADGWVAASPAYLNHKIISREAFGVFDSKGREIGCQASIQTLKVTASKDKYAAHYHPSDFGEWFLAIVQSTRNGEKFGAGQGGEFFRTETECLNYIAARVAASRKSAAHKIK